MSLALSVFLLGNKEVKNGKQGLEISFFCFFFFLKNGGGKKNVVTSNTRGESSPSPPTKKKKTPSAPAGEQLVGVVELLHHAVEPLLRQRRVGAERVVVARNGVERRVGVSEIFCIFVRVFVKFVRFFLASEGPPLSPRNEASGRPFERGSGKEK